LGWGIWGRDGRDGLAHILINHRLYLKSCDVQSAPADSDQRVEAMLVVLVIAMQDVQLSGLLLCDFAYFLGVSQTVTPRPEHLETIEEGLELGRWTGEVYRSVEEQSIARPKQVLKACPVVILVKQDAGTTSSAVVATPAGYDLPLGEKESMGQDAPCRKFGTFGFSCSLAPATAWRAGDDQGGFDCSDGQGGSTSDSAHLG
jgi:hypothetical protein